MLPVVPHFLDIEGAAAAPVPILSSKGKTHSLLLYDDGEGDYSSQT